MGYFFNFHIRPVVKLHVISSIIVMPNLLFFRAKREVVIPAMGFLLSSFVEMTITLLQFVKTLPLLPPVRAFMSVLQQICLILPSGEDSIWRTFWLCMAFLQSWD
jgi:hypothetical protein